MSDQSALDEAQVRVTCPDKTGLGSDIARTIFDAKSYDAVQPKPRC